MNEKREKNEVTLVFSAIILLAIFLGFLSNCYGQTAQDCMEKTALRLTGIREEGHNDGAVVNYMLAYCNLANTNEAYCGATVYAAHIDCGIPQAALPDAPCWSPAWARKDKVVWRNGESPEVIQKDMTVQLWSETKQRITHVGWVLYKAKDGHGWYIVYFSGNTRDPQNKWNPGDGFHLKKIYLTNIHSISDWRSQPNAPIAKYHIVQPRETLYRLSVMYGVSIEDLRKWNRITDNGIFVGQEIKVG